MTLHKRHSHNVACLLSVTKNYLAMCPIVDRCCAIIADIMLANEVVRMSQSAPLLNMLSPREVRIHRAATFLRWGAVIHVALLFIVLGLAAIAGMNPNLLPTWKAALLFRFSGADDVALAIVFLTLMGMMSALLVVMVGLLAREVWGLVGVWVLVLVSLGLLIGYGYTFGLVAGGSALITGVIASRDPRAYRTNPVMLKELRGRMRGMRAFVVLTVYLGLMSLFLGLIYLSFTAFNTLSSAAAGAAGRLLFAGVVGVELLLILFIAPAFTSGAITGERERQTYDLLQTTLLASPSFIVGKLESALSYVLLLLLAAIPLQSLAFLFGGVSQAEVLIAFVILAVTAIAMGTIGIYFSTVASRTLTASVQTYTVSILGAFVVPFLLGLIVRVLNNAFGDRSQMLEAGFAYAQQVFVSLNPVQAAQVSQQFLVERQTVGFTSLTLTNGAQVPIVSPWINYTMIYLMLSALMLVLSVRQMRRTATAD
jgi:ABC-2 type transport system permease protein